VFVVRLAAELGYPADALSNHRTSRTWPLRRRVQRASHLLIRPVRRWVARHSAGTG
jgi:hypothetical protein